MEMNEFIICVLVLVIFISGVMYKITHKSPRFRIVKTSFSYDQSTYTPQVRIGGIWFNVVINLGYVSIDAQLGESFLDPEDAIKLIDKYKNYGKMIIISNRKLDSSQKQIIVE